MLKLAWPVVLTQLGMMGMGLVDTLMVGPLGPVALGAVSIGNTVHMTVQLILMGWVMGSEPLMSRAFGAGTRTECGRTLWQALWLSVAFGFPLAAFLHRPTWILEALRQKPEIVTAGGEYIVGRAFAIPGFLLFASQRFFLNSVGNPLAVLRVAVVANIANAGLDYVFIYGAFGVPAMGVFGVGLATAVCTFVMAGVAALGVFGGSYREFGLEPHRPDRARMAEILRIGVPVGFQIGAEMGVFAMTALMIGWIGSGPLAAHQVAITLASFTFMVPLGVSVAAAVRVGQSLGAGDPAGAARAGRIAIVMGVLFMSTSALVFLLAPQVLVRMFTDDPSVVALGKDLLRVAGVFQISDGMQIVAAGCLRGAADTKVSLIMNLVGHWCVGLPVGYALAFHAGLGAQGLWIGLTVSLTIVGVALVWRFLRGRWQGAAM